MEHSQKARDKSSQKLFWLMLLVLPYLFFSKNASAQAFKMYQSTAGAEMLVNQNDTLLNPWAGGVTNPQFSNIDANSDGRQDIFVFEPADGKVHIYLRQKNGSFRYAPEYESAFPKMKSWALLADYNGDGKADIFTFSQIGAGMDVYKNISSGSDLLFQLVERRMQYQDIDFRLNLYVPATDIPAIADVDNDGDLDILSYDVLQYHIQYYKNLSMEKYGKPDSLDFRIADRCWGKFAESFTANTVVLGEDCGSVGKREKQHGGSTLLVFDNDNDGDKDMLLGDIGYSNLIFLENGRIKNNTPFTESDSMIFVDTVFPRNSRKAEISLYPAGFLVDVNGDNIKDLLVSPQGLFESKTANQVFAYLNRGSNTKPVFEHFTNNFLQSSMFHGEERSAPAFLDYNNDSLMDLVVAVKGNTQNTYNFSKLQLYQNIGTKNKAVYKLAKDNFISLLNGNERAALSPKFADINGDGKPDLILGNEAGEVHFYYNGGLGTDNLPTFTNANLPLIDVGQYSKPALADVNRDGLMDLVVGEQSGNFNYFSNTGTQTAPVFTLVSDTFGSFYTNHFYYQYEYDDSGRVVDSVLMKEPNGASSPEIADMDGDGKWDLLAGTIYGELFICFNIEDSLSGRFQPRAEFIYNPLTDKNIAVDFGFVSVPAAADINGDGKPEIFVGNYKGGLYYLASQPVVLSVNEKQENHNIAQLKVYPNPATQNLYIELPQNAFNQTYSLQVINPLGKVLYAKTVKNSSGQNVKIDVSRFAPGFYFVKLVDENGKHFSAKIYMQP